jgi:flagellar hook-associated protein 2
MVGVTGVGSGLDIEGLVTQLVSAERAPTESRLLRREAALTSEISAFGSFKGSLSAFENSLSALGNLSTFNQRDVSSSDSDVVTATTSGQARPASYAVEVDQLATAQSLASGTFASLSEQVGEGTLTIRFGTTAYTPADPGPESYDGFTADAERDSLSITIDSSNNSVRGVADAINAADAGITAVTVNDGGGVRLLISSQETGANNSIEIAVDDTGDGNDGDTEGLSRLAFNASDNNLSQTVAAQDAIFRINGLSLSSASNTVEEVIDGVDLTLVGTSSGSATTLSISENRAAVRDAIEGFVNSFNSFFTTANNLTRFNAETGVAGPLQGDFTARSVISQVRNAVTGAAQGIADSFSTIAEIGITSTASGTLEIDDARLDAALADNFNSVAGIFAQAGRASSSNISVLGTSAATQLGSYEIVVTSVASPGGEPLAATIGGEPATIEGSVLVGAAGSAAEGLRVDVGTPAVGSLGSVTVSQGIIAPLQNVLSGFLDSGAILDSRTEGLQASIDDIEEDREALNLRLEAIEARFRSQFNALDVLLANLQSTGDFLQRQLDSIPVPGANSNN